MPGYYENISAGGYLWENHDWLEIVPEKVPSLLSHWWLCFVGGCGIVGGN